MAESTLKQKHVQGPSILYFQSTQLFQRFFVFKRKLKRQFDFSALSEGSRVIVIEFKRSKCRRSYLS